MNRVLRELREKREWFCYDVADYVAKVRGWRRDPAPLFRIRHSRKHARSSGSASRVTGIRLTLGLAANLPETAELVMHEMLHWELGRDQNGDWHGESFRLALAGTARRAWGVEVDPFTREVRNGNRAYALDEQIVQALKGMWWERCDE